MALSSLAGDPAEQAEALSVLGNRHRLEILWAVWRGEEPVAFSTIQERTGIADNGRLNYHLSRLEEHFVEREEHGVELRPVAHSALRMVFRTTVLETGGMGPTEVAGECIDCGAGLVFSYRDQDARVDCPECGRFYAQAYLPFPLGDRPVAEAVTMLAERHRQFCRCTAKNICPKCNGPLGTALRGLAVPVLPEKTSLRSPRDPRRPWPVHPPRAIANNCARCGTSFNTPVGAPLLYDTRVVAFNADNGVDLEALRPWEIDFMHDQRLVSVVEWAGRSPRRVRVSIPRDDATLHAEVDAADASLASVVCE